MDNLLAKPAIGKGITLTVGDVTLMAVDMVIFSLSINSGKSTKAAEILNSKMGLDWPKEQEIKRKHGVSAFWFDHNHICLMGAQPDATLSTHCNVIDISDGWCVVDIFGTHVRDVLARLTPLDMRSQVFKIGVTQRSDLMHMQASISCLEKDHFRLMVFRSMAVTLVHDLTRAMESVAARSKTL